MYGLTVRWSLAQAEPGALEQLRQYVEDVSFAKFAAIPDLRFKVWRAREDEWFEGFYIFSSDEARSAFQTEFTKNAAQAPVTTMVGSAPLTIEAFEVVAAVRGTAGFRSAARFES